VSVQPMEPQFFALAMTKLGLDPATLPHQQDRSSWPWMTKRLEGIFKTKTRDEWEAVFKGTDACVAPVLSVIEAAKHPHNVARGSFGPTPEHPGLFEPCPAPQLSRTPGHRPRPKPTPGSHTLSVLHELGLPKDTIESLMKSGGAVDKSASSKL
jgi:alpha-methylacyl-CoA racemase